MSKAPKDGNGSTPIGSPESNGRTPAAADSRRVRTKNTIEPSPSVARAARPREHAARRGREHAVPAGEQTRRGSERDGTPREQPRNPVNTIRPTPRRVRDVPAPPEERTHSTRPPGAPGPAARSADREAATDPYLVPDEIKQRFVQVGRKYHFPDGARAFTDHGNRLTSPSENSEVIKSLISIAQVRGWSDITLSGTERFRKEAWFAARLAGLDVRGYTPTEFEQGRLVRTLARTQAPAMQSPAPDAPPSSAAVARDGRASTAPRAGGARDEVPAAPRERQRTLQAGRLVDHGAAPYLQDPHNAMSYFVRIETPGGEREIWGVDLQRALKESLTRPQIGDEIGVRALRRDAVKVSRPEHDGDGRVIGEKTLEAHRNAWVVEKRDFFQERAQAARVLRDPSVDRQAAVKQHPELLGTYLQLHAAELAAKTLRHPEDQQRFVASVRTALADSVARGEPLSPVPLKDTVAKRREPRVPTSPERDAAPAR